jgi:hypothetical protein
MKYITYFNKHSNYETYINGNPDLPNLSYCEDAKDLHITPYSSPQPIAPVGKVQVFANPECTAYADGQSKEVWARLNQDFGYDDVTFWGNISSGHDYLAVYTPSTENPTDSYAINVWVDWYSEDFTEPFTSGQIIKCTCPYGDPIIDNVQVIFE